MLNTGLPYSELYYCVEVERDGRGLCPRAFPKAMQTTVITTSLYDQIVDTGST